jgi:hypothetical protein
MKKLIVLTSFIFIGYTASAQEIGVRVGNVLGNSAAVDAVFGVGEFSRIHADISFGDGGVGVEALWDFIYRPLGGEAFNWYLGGGPSVLFDDDFRLGASGEIGLEYRFNGVPLALGIDWRPTLYIVEQTSFDAGGFGLNFRYVFGRNR